MPSPLFGRLAGLVRSLSPYAMLLVASCSGCERTRGTAANDTATPGQAPPDSAGTSARAATGWYDQDGPAMLIAGASETEAAVIFPSMVSTLALQDTTAYALADIEQKVFTVYRRGGVAGEVQVTSAGRNAAGNACWPVASLRAARGEGLPSWTVGFLSGHAIAIPADSIEGLSRRDSVAMATELARAVSALTDDQAEPYKAFRGLPVVVEDARRFFIREGSTATEIIVASTTRRLATEANPREEQLLVIAERDSGSTEHVMPRFTRRNAGPEDQVIVTEVLAALKLGGTSPRINVVTSQEFGNSVGYVILERTASGEWRERWRTPLIGGC